MEYTINFSIDGVPQDVTITLSGIATLQELWRYNDELVSDPCFRAGLTMLIDASTLDTAQLSDENLMEAALDPLIERDWHHPPRAVAIVAADPQTFNARVRAQAHLGGSRSRRRVFASQEAAVGWLEEQRRSDTTAS